MKLLADLHTHSKNSRFGHGKNTIEEMAIEANEIGLVEIGITDHGYAHFFRTSKQKLKKAREIVDEINEWSKTKVLLGVEADIIREDGTLDIDNETLSMLDILIVGYHRLISTDFANFFGGVKNTEEAKRKCTNAYINAINKYPVTIISHLDSVLNTDLYEIGKACSEKNVLIEINNRHTNWTEKQMNDLIDSGCMFVLSSDAHSRDKVGDVEKAMEYVTKYNIPSERIANVEFSESEKSEQDRIYTVYKSVYEELDSTKRKRNEEIEEKLNSQIRGSLSSEMEEELQKIAKEKGLYYQSPKRETAEVADDDRFFEDRFVGSTREYVKEDKFNNFREENDLIEEDETQYSFDDNHPLVSDSFANKFQSINSVIKQNEQPQQEINADGSELRSNHIENTIPAYEQLQSSTFDKTDIEGLKNLMAGKSPRMTVEKNDEKTANHTKSEISQVSQTEPENFMQSITMAKPKNEEYSQQMKESQTEQSPEMKRHSRKGGGFVVIDKLIDDDKNTNK